MQHREAKILGGWGLLTVAALSSVVLFNDWNPLGFWIISPRCENGLLHEHVYLNADGQWRSYSHAHVHSLAHVQAEEPPEAIVNFLFDYVITATNYATSYAGWWPPTCD